MAKVVLNEKEKALLKEACKTGTWTDETRKLLKRIDREFVADCIVNIFPEKVKELSEVGNRTVKVMKTKYEKDENGKRKFSVDGNGKKHYFPLKDEQGKIVKVDTGETKMDDMGLFKWFRNEVLNYKPKNTKKVLSIDELIAKYSK